VGSVTRQKYSTSEIERYLREERNWGRWGENDQLGAVNLITPDKRRQAASLVKQGKTVSMSRPLPTRPGVGNPKPASHYFRSANSWEGHTGYGFVADYVGIDYHGLATTHLDALCHTWDQQGGWNGRQPCDGITSEGIAHGEIDAWRDGIVTRGVLLDVPRYRKDEYVTAENPVHGWELEEICSSENITLEPGDALVVHSGREAWDRRNPPWNGPDFNGEYARPRPGLHASCLIFLRDHDCSLLVWDMTDAKPAEEVAPMGVHSAIYAFGIGLVDSALLEPLAVECAAARSWEFLFMLAPLRLVGGTGSPANPVAVL
jgi:kynurenine formamidase